MTILPAFAAFEGCDGSGTTTQLRLLEERFRAAGAALPPLFTSAEPGEGPVGALLRRFLRGDFPLSPLAASHLFAADRAEHFFGAEGIVPRTQAGYLAVSDRCVLSSLVYQGPDAGEAAVLRINERFPLPQLLLFFDIAPELAQERLSARPSRDIFEHLAFQQKARERYLAWAPRFAEWGVHTVIIDAAAPKEEVSEKVWAALQNMPILKTRINE
ncbi:MAG: dTMP kinase [Treponema sp.]|jgi:dTMP kinase|nr:dTMP kinase [Treponema sp.]